MEPPRKVLVIRPRFLGDLILSTGLAEIMGQHWPGVEVWYLAETPFDEVLKHHPAIHQVITFDAKRKNNLSYLWKFYGELRRQRFDVVFDLFGNPRTAQMSFFSGAPVRVGFELRGRSWAYSLLAPASSTPLASGRRPVTEAYLDQLRVLGLKMSQPYRTLLKVTDEEKDYVRKLFSRAQIRPDEKVAVLTPGASWPAKHWPLERFAELGYRLKAEGFRIISIFGPKDQELAEKFQDQMDKDWIFLNQPSLRGLMAFIEAADVLVSNDAGPMHVGPAVGTPTLGIFGPGEPEVWFPYASPHRIVYEEVPCGHCGLDRCPLMACMDHVTAEKVAALVLQTVGENPIKSL